MKENDLAHGEFGKWLESVNITSRQAQRFIKVYNRFGKTTPGSYLPNALRVLDELTSFTDEQLEQEYELPDESTADFLRQKESNMRQIVGKAYTELGKELYEAQQDLRRQESKDGVFMEWYMALGFKKDNVSRLINRYKLFAKCEEPKRKIIEDMPVTLSYEIASPSAESTPEKAQAKSEVLAGDIATLKEYRERIRELERKAEQAEKQAEVERRELERYTAYVHDIFFQLLKTLYVVLTTLNVTTPL